MEALRKHRRGLAERLGSLRRWRRRRAWAVIAAGVFAAMWALGVVWFASFVQRPDWGVGLHDGAVWVETLGPPIRLPEAVAKEDPGRVRARLTRRDNGIVAWPGFARATITTSRGRQVYGLWWFPLWIPVAACTIGAACAHRRVRRLAVIGRCWKCTYSVEGLPVGAVCPECGADRWALR